MTRSVRSSCWGRAIALALLATSFAATSESTAVIARKLEEWLVLGSKSSFSAPPRVEPASADAMRTAAAALLHQTFSSERWQARAEIASRFHALVPAHGSSLKFEDWYVESKLRLGAQCDFTGERVLLAGDFENAQAALLARELAVLLFQQNIGLAGFLDVGDDDERIARRMTLLGLARFLARRAVATHAHELSVMLDAADAKSMPPLSPRDVLASMLAPQYVIERFALEEERGENFVERLYAEGGADALRNLLTSPPHSSSDVLHPEAFVSAPTPVLPALDQVDLTGKLGEHWKKLYVGRIGEFEAELILRLGGDPVRARLAAEGFGSDAITCYGDPARPDLPLLHWSIVATSETDAGEVIDAFKKLFEKRAAVPDQSIKSIVITDPKKTRIEVRSGNTIGDASALPLSRLVTRTGNRVEVLSQGSAPLELEGLLPH